MEVLEAAALVNIGQDFSHVHKILTIYWQEKQKHTQALLRLLGGR